LRQSGNDSQTLGARSYILLPQSCN
jgi:hypothetical protein